MPTTYEPIATTTLSTTQADVTFSSISGNFTDLVLIANVRGTVNNYTRVQFNGDTNTNYSLTELTGNGSAASSARSSNLSYAYFQGAAVNNSSSLSYVGIAHIMNYSNTTTNKTVIARSNEAGSAVDAVVALWRSTASITSIKLYPNTGSFASGSTFTLYGIKSA
jgi:hypothetical protein